jgi:hypothetical protein
VGETLERGRLEGRAPGVDVAVQRLGGGDLLAAGVTVAFTK